MAYRIEETDSAGNWQPVTTGDYYGDKPATSFWTKNYEVAQEIAQDVAVDSEDEYDSRVIDSETGKVLNHYRLRSLEVIDLLDPPSWIRDLREALIACEHPESMSDADIAEHNLAGVVCQYRDEILGVWAR